MKIKYLFVKIGVLMILLLKFAFVSTTWAQEAIVTNGNNASGTGGSVSSTIGQVLYTTHTGAGGTVLQGVQLPFDISIVNQKREAKDIRLECIVSPNPTSDVVKLTIQDCRKADLSYQLFDINGKLLSNKKIDNIETTISMQGLAVSTYFVKIIEGRQEIKVFKIIKN